MRIRQLEYFVAVAESLHFTRAAKSVGVSQPVLSSQIQALETELETALFTRTSREVRITPAGESFLADARLILGQLDDAIRRVHRTAQTTLRVGTYTSGMSLERPILEACGEAWPEVEISLVILGWGDIGAALRRGYVDVAFTRLPETHSFPAYDGLMIARLRRDLRVVIVADDHPLARFPQLSLRDLADYPLVAPASLGTPERDWWTVNPRPDGSAARYRRTAGSMAELLDLVSISQEIGITTQSIGEAQARPGISFIPLIDADPAAIALAWDSTTSNQSIGRFIEIAKRAAADR